MAGDENWVDVGATDELSRTPLETRDRDAAGPGDLVQGRRSSAPSRMSAITSAARSARAALDGEYIVCPWHNWKFHRCSGEGEPGFEDDRVPSYPVKVENGRVLVNIAAATKRTKAPHEPHPLARKVERAPRPAAARRHRDNGDGRGASALFRLGSSARSRA